MAQARQIVAVAGRPPRPKRWLDDEAKHVWKRLAPELWSKGLLTNLHLDTFAILCTAIVHHKRAYEYVRTMLVQGQKGSL